jgi:hypothetical protein
MIILVDHAFRILAVCIFLKPQIQEISKENPEVLCLGNFYFDGFGHDMAL